MTELKSVGVITGELSPVGRISGSVSQEIKEAPIYEGEVEVTPSAHEEQTLETMDKLLKSNITIHKVPFFETHNLTGLTVYIATEV